MRTRLIAGLTTIAAGVLFAGCTVRETEIPPLAGPSEFALSITMHATPDHITQDGASQSSILITARGADGQPVSGVPFRLDMVAGGEMQDYGRLSARTVVTGADGKANAVYTAPAAPPISFGGSGVLMSVMATAVGSNYQSAWPHSVEIRLIPPGVILPPAATPLPSFSVSPTPLVANVAANFTGTATCDGFTCVGASYSWNFGDGSSDTGQTVSKAYSAPGTYQATLTVTSDRGISASTTQAISVGSSGAPTARILTSPPSPQPQSQVIYFNAETSTAASGRRIVSYSWNFGDGTSLGGSFVQKQFAGPGTYTVVLTVQDDAGGVGTASASFTVTP